MIADCLTNYRAGVGNLWLASQMWLLITASVSLDIFLTRLLRMKLLSVIFLQSHQQHRAAPEVALTVRSMLLKRKFRHLPLFKTVDFA